jgi:hypothetical protein
MTPQEYNQKLTEYMASDADPTIKTAAIQKLHDDYFGARFRALKLIEESAPDIPKVD